MNKVVVITGGSSGIGLGLKKRFESQGDIVYSISKSNPFETSNHIECDVTDEQLVKKAFEQIKSNHSKIDILINSAGYGLFGATELIPAEQVKKQMDTNFFGTYLSTKYALGMMTEGGKIVNIGSVCGLFPSPYRNIYNVSKAAVSSFTDGLRMELKQAKIDVCCICPAEVQTPFVDSRVKVLEKSERYGDIPQNIIDKVGKSTKKRMPLDKAEDIMFKIINKKKYKSQYIVGTKFKWLSFITRFLPKSVYEKAVCKKIIGKQK